MRERGQSKVLVVNEAAGDIRGKNRAMKTRARDDDAK